MAFKRYDGFSGSIPQKFIDSTLISCPICGSNNPHWELEMKMKLDWEGNQYLFRCQQCGCILSGRVPDVTGFNKTPLTTTGLIKKFKGKKNEVIYMTVEDVGTQLDMAKHVGVEMPLENLVRLRHGVNSSQNDRKFKFCTQCGTKVNISDKFCTNCGNRL